MKGTWTDLEDKNLLLQCIAVSEITTPKWDKVAQSIPGKTAEAIRYILPFFYSPLYSLTSQCITILLSSMYYFLSLFLSCLPFTSFLLFLSYQIPRHILNSVLSCLHLSDMSCLVFTN